MEHFLSGVKSGAIIAHTKLHKCVSTVLTKHKWDRKMENECQMVSDKHENSLL